uniref:Uncharacterized protein n=1 Tax=Periophthalmus magnuspinnatus TaxID=409849 RepID=A0A3B3ZFX9_9GOBI
MSCLILIVQFDVEEVLMLIYIYIYIYNTFPKTKKYRPSSVSVAQDFTTPGLHQVNHEFENSNMYCLFIQVFSLVFLQLLFTFCVVCIFTFSSTVKELVQSSIWVYVSAYIVFAVVVVPLSLCTSLSRRHPWNLIALVVVTVSLSYMVGTIASYHDTMTVIMAMGATLTISLGIIAFATQSRYDFTLCYVLLLILGLDLLMFVVFSSFYYSHMADVGYGSLGALLFSLMMTGSMSHRVSPEDYVTAALIIYLDIVLIFLYLLGRR